MTGFPAKSLRVFYSPFKNFNIRLTLKPNYIPALLKANAFATTALAKKTILSTTATKRTHFQLIFHVLYGSNLIELIYYRLYSYHFELWGGANKFTTYVIPKWKCFIAFQNIDRRN